VWRRFQIKKKEKENWNIWNTQRNSRWEGGGGSVVGRKEKSD
jgi:hypothetical protein